MVIIMAAHKWGLFFIVVGILIILYGSFLDWMSSIFPTAVTLNNPTSALNLIAGVLVGSMTNSSLLAMQQYLMMQGMEIMLVGFFLVFVGIWLGWLRNNSKK
jgi:uncharacterized membrane protein